MFALVETAVVPTVSLEQMLAAREQRAARQTAALVCFNKPVVSMTVVMPGPVKDGWLPRRVLSEALKQLEAISDKRGWHVLSREVLWRETGPEALYVIDVEARILKSATVALEDCHPIGRLWDLDVLAPGSGQLSRRELSFSPRRCLVCGEPAHACSRSRLHPLDELLSTIAKIVHDHDLRPIN